MNMKVGICTIIPSSISTDIAMLISDWLRGGRCYHYHCNGNHGSQEVNLKSCILRTLYSFRFVFSQLSMTGTYQWLIPVSTCWIFHNMAQKKSFGTNWCKQFSRHKAFLWSDPTIHYHKLAPACFSTVALAIIPREQICVKGMSLCYD
jgi:hypothetical protein